MQLIKVRYLKGDLEVGRPYTFYSKEIVEVGDKVQINGNTKGVVSSINVEESEIEAFKDKVKTILGKLQDFYFTFCADQNHAGHYVKINGTYASAREKMIERYSEKWGFQYFEKEWAKNVEEMKKIGFPVETEFVESE